MLDPLPGVVGFCKVVSMRVQPSPLRRQAPRYTFRILLETICSLFTSLEVTMRCRFLVTNVTQNISYTHAIAEINGPFEV